MRYGCTVISLLFFVFCFHVAGARKIKDRHYKFSIIIPDAMKDMTDKSEVVEGDLFYDSTAQIVLMISKRQSRFNSVQEYIDCSKKQLESQLKYFYSDSTLTLVSCNRSVYYPDKATVLVFNVSVLPHGFNTCTVYFINRLHRDIQFSFTYKKERGQQSAQYIDQVMRSLTLK
jgi:hypothetical protein